MPSRIRTLAAIFLSQSLIAIALVPAAPPPAKLALQGARIVPIEGDEIDSGTVLIVHGRIQALGPKVEVPYDAMVVDLSGHVIMPGMIDAHSWRGLDVPNENLPVTPYLDVYDALDPSKLYFEDALRDGVTSIHVIVGNDCVIGGLSRVVHPIGLTPNEMTLQRDVALKLSVAPKRGSDRMAQMATFRETFRELKEYLEELAEKKYEESLKDKGEQIDVGPDVARERGKPLIQPEDYDDEHRNLVRLTRGDLGAFIYAELASDVGRALQLAREHNFLDRTVLVLGPDCYKAVSEVQAAGRPVILQPPYLYRERNPITAEIKETFVPQVMAQAGIPFSLLPDPDSSMAERYLNYQAARCLRYGVPRQTALEAITRRPAEALRIDDRVGKLAPGMVANLVVLSGDPLDFNSWVERVYIQGVLAYDRQQDVRLKRLLEAEQDAEDTSSEATETGEKEPKKKSEVALEDEAPPKDQLPREEKVPRKEKEPPKEAREKEPPKEARLLNEVRGVP